MQRYTSRAGLVFALAVGLFTGCSGESGGPISGEVVYGTVKPIDGEKWILLLSGESDRSYSITVDEAGRFKAPKVAAGTYSIAVTHYLPTPEPTKGPARVGTGPPKQFNYLDLWTVPGGPFTLDLTKLKPKK